MFVMFCMLFFNIVKGKNDPMTFQMQLISMACALISSCSLCRHFFEEAMAKGYVETSITKCLIIGAAGVGKTHLRHLLLKKDPPKQRTSTGLADNPVRTISCSLVDTGEQEDDWFVVEDTQALINAIGRTIRSDKHVGASVIDQLSTDITEIAADTSSEETLKDPAYDHCDDMADMSEIVLLEKDLIHHINNSSGKFYWK